MGIKTKKFSQLSATSDGKLILANDNKLYQSTSSLSELVPNVDNLASKELVQETSATITGMIPSTAGLATETDLQTVSGALSNYEQKITYGYDENAAITAINNSAIGGTGGASYIAGQGIKIENDTISISSSNCSVTGAYAFAEGQNNSAHGNYSHAEGSKTIASESDSHAEGSRTSAVGFDTHTEGAYTYAIGSQSHAEGNQTSALGLASHAEGQETKAIGDHSHAEGYATRTSGEKSHAEGLFTTAFGKCSHAEGESTKASGYASHAEGSNTSAIANYSHTEGYYTIADYSAMHVGGALNKTSSDALFVLGNGNVTIQGGQYVWNRSDAFIVYPNGSVSAAGKISANGVELGAGGGSNYSYITVNMPNITPSYDFNYVQIGNQKWMNSNLTIDDGGSGISAYAELPDYQGRIMTGRNLYTYGAAKRIADSIPGWHLPTYDEVKTLFQTLGDLYINSSMDDNRILACKYGKKLKSQSAWHSFSPEYANAANGTDDYGFNCCPMQTSTAIKDNDGWPENTQIWCYEHEISAEGKLWPMSTYLYLNNHDNLYNNYDYVYLMAFAGFNDSYFGNVRLIKDEE